MDNKHYFDIAKDFIKKFEGCKLAAYLDVADIPTIGYGCTYHLDGKKVRVGDEITIETAEKMLLKNIMELDAYLNQYVKVKLTDGQRAALLSLTYNIGIGNFRFSTMLKKINDSDFEGAANELERWKWSGGKVINGLIRRRVAEKELFLS